MPENDALRGFSFPKSKGLFVKFDDGDEYKLRVLTTDPIVTTQEFEGADGEVNISTKFSFIVYNWTLGKAQILSAGATITKAIQKLHQDEEWGANIKKMDIRISATGQQMKRKYTITPLPKAETMSSEQIKECQAINLDEKIPDGQRMSFYTPPENTGYEQAKATAEALRPEVKDEDVVVEDLGEEINLDDIPF